MSQEKLKPSEWVDAYERGARHVLDYMKWSRDHVAQGCYEELSIQERAIYVLIATEEIIKTTNHLIEDGIIH